MVRRRDLEVMAARISELESALTYYADHKNWSAYADQFLFEDKKIGDTSGPNVARAKLGLSSLDAGSLSDLNANQMNSQTQFGGGLKKS